MLDVSDSKVVFMLGELGGDANEKKPFPEVLCWLSLGVGRAVSAVWRPVASLPVHLEVDSRLSVQILLANDDTLGGGLDWVGMGACLSNGDD